jgi:hypothetical protein
MTVQGIETDKVPLAWSAVVFLRPEVEELVAFAVVRTSESLNKGQN